MDFFCGFFIVFYTIFDDLFDDFFDIFQHMSILQDVCFSLGKTRVFKVRHLHFIMFFLRVVHNFRHRIVYGLFMILGAIFGFIFHAFSTLWSSFSHICSVSIFHDFWMPFWTTFRSKSIHRGGIPSITFFIKSNVFSGPRSGYRFLMDFDGFGSHFGHILTDLNAFSHR